MNAYCCGVVESKSLKEFPYGGQPILCTPVGNSWQRLQYEIILGTVVVTNTIGPPRHLADHSFQLGDYVVCEPIRFMPFSFAVVYPNHRVQIANSFLELVVQLAKNLLTFKVTSLPRNVKRSLLILKDARQVLVRRKLNLDRR